MVRRGRPVPARAPGARSRPPRDRRRALIGAVWHRPRSGAAPSGAAGRAVDVEARACTAPCWRGGTACVAQKHACLLEKEVAAAGPLLKNKYHNIYIYILIYNIL